jgi:hypothetical protein
LVSEYSRDIQLGGEFVGRSEIVLISCELRYFVLVLSWNILAQTYQTHSLPRNEGLELKFRGLG